MFNWKKMLLFAVTALVCLFWEFPMVPLAFVGIGVAVGCVVHLDFIWFIHPVFGIYMLWSAGMCMGYIWMVRHEYQILINSLSQNPINTPPGRRGTVKLRVVQ